jgi:hypothetical protein
MALQIFTKRRTTQGPEFEDQRQSLNENRELPSKALIPSHPKVHLEKLMEQQTRIKQATTPNILKYYAGAPFENSPPASQLPMPPAWMLSRKQISRQIQQQKNTRCTT